jgi:hypothetical protein
VGVAAGAGHTGFSTGGHASVSAGFAIVAGGGAVTQPAREAASTAAAMEDNGVRRIGIGGLALGWVFLEIALALAIAIAIVWWTLPRKPRRGDNKDEGGNGDAGR